MRCNEALDQLGELQQVGNSNQCTSCAESDLRIGSYNVCPLRRNRTNLLLVDLQKQAFAVPVVSLA